MTTLISHPTLDLFTYDLRNSLGKSADKNIENNRARFKQKLPKNLLDGRFDELDKQEFNTEYVNLIDRLSTTIIRNDDDCRHRVYEESKKSGVIKFDTKTHDGYYYPVRLDDCYGLLLECSLNDAQPAENLTWLADLKEFVLNKVNNDIGEIGHTWMFFAQVEMENMQAYEDLAKKCYRTIVPETPLKREVIRKGRFLEGYFFEFDLEGYVSSESDVHQMIIFYPTEETYQRAQSTINALYSEWMRLWCHRHKIMWAYRNGWSCREILERLNDEIQPFLEGTKNSLQRHELDKLQDSLNEAWQHLVDYTNHLTDLAFQAHTIKLNCHNYQKRLGRIIDVRIKETWATQDGTSEDLKQLSEFAETANQDYLQRVQEDHAVLELNLRLLENYVQYTRATVQIEEGKRERRLETHEREFQHQVSIFAVALAAGAIMASISGHFPTSATVGTALTDAKWPWDWFFSSTWLAPSISILISFVTAFLAGWIAKLFLDKKWNWLALGIIGLGMVFLAGWVATALLG